MDELLLVVIAVATAIFVGWVSHIVTVSETAKQCDAFGKTFLKGKVYTCAKSAG